MSILNVDVLSQPSLILQRVSTNPTRNPTKHPTHEHPTTRQSRWTYPAGWLEAFCVPGKPKYCRDRPLAERCLPVTRQTRTGEMPGPRPSPGSYVGSRDADDSDRPPSPRDSPASAISWSAYQRLKFNWKFKLDSEQLTQDLEQTVNLDTGSHDCRGTQAARLRMAHVTRPAGATVTRFKTISSGI